MLGGAVTGGLAPFGTPLQLSSDSVFSFLFSTVCMFSTPASILFGCLSFDIL